MRYLAISAAIISTVGVDPAFAAPVRVEISQLLNDHVALHGANRPIASSNVKVGNWEVTVSRSYLQGQPFLSASATDRPSIVDLEASQLLNDDVALRGVNVSTASSRVKVAKWNVAVSQSYLQDRSFIPSNASDRPSIVDVRQKARHGFQNLSISAQRSFPLWKRLHLDVTMASSVPMGGPFGTNRFDNSGDAMLEADFDSSSFWVGVTQHERSRIEDGDRKALAELYAGASRQIDRLTSLRGNYYHAQSDEIGRRSVTNLSLGLNRDLPDLGSVQLNASRNTDSENKAWRAGLSLELDRLPF